MSDADDITRWRERVELIDGVLTWRSDPARSKQWNTLWAGKPASKHVSIGGRRLSSARIAEALATGRIPPEGFISLADRRSGLPEQDVQVSACPDYEEITRLSAALGRTTVDLVALSKVRDPFFVMPFRQARARWFVDVWRALAPGADVHIRRLHYRYVSLPVGERSPKLNGQPYENTDRDYQTFTDASQDARSLGLVDETMFTDRRNGEPKFVADANGENEGSWSGVVGAFVSRPEPEEVHFQYAYRPRAIDFPYLPSALVTAPRFAEPYAIEIWAEKSTMNDILEPLARRLNVTLVTGLGELSYTHCMWHVRRVLAHRKKTRILYISDFDPSGERMPVSVARKIEFLLRRDGHDLDIRLDPLILTREQVQHYRLPRIPIKDSDKSKARFEAQHGEGAVELDALEALHPGELARIVRAAVNVYREPARRAARTNAAIANEANRVYQDHTNAACVEFADEISDLRDAFAATTAENEADQEALANIAREATERSQVHVDAMNERMAALHDRAEALWGRIGSEIEQRLTATHEDFDWVEPSAADEGEALFDSSRAYLEQIDAYKAHGGAE
jgi:hypothetical protein